MKKIINGILTIMMFFSCQKVVSEKNNPRNQLSLEWGNVINLPEKQVFTSNFILKNHSNRAWKNKNWTIYFNFVRTFINTSPEVIIKHINGDFYKMEPSPHFKEIKPQGSLKIHLKAKFWATSVSDAPQGPFIVYKDTQGKIIRKENLPYTVLPFNPSSLKRTAHDNVPIANAQWHYEQNQKMTCIAKEDLPKIIPSPVFYDEGKNTVDIPRNIPVFYQNEVFKNEAKNMASRLHDENSFSSKAVSVNKLTKAKGIYLIADSSIKNKEGYTLEIKGNRVVIKAKDTAGIFYGIQSFQALLPLDNKEKISLREAKIKDYPRYAYRGMHIDVARNFQPKAMIKQLIRQMAFYKLNTLHFHLTDDEGWRLEIPALPELTKIGSNRYFQSKSEKGEGMLPSFGSGAEKDFPGSGYYSKKDFIEILQYAQRHHVKVIPEIDMPGHARAAIVSMKYRYDRLMKAGKEKEAKQYLLNDLNDKSVYRSVQLWNDNVVNPCMESTYAFFNIVVDEIITMYKEAGVSLEVVHTGGDEVPEGVWEKSEVCHEIKGLRKKVLSQKYTDRISKILQAKGLKTGGWEEIALKKHGVQLHINKELDKKNIRLYIWNNIWGGDKQDIGYRLANAGYDVVLSNVTNLYFDLAYEKNPKEIGYYWGGYVNTRKVYEFTPDNIALSAYDDLYGNEISRKTLENFVPLTAEGKKHIIGIQGQLWGENAHSPLLAEYLIYPKLIALAERAWSKQPAWATILAKEKRTKVLNKYWNVFANQLASNELPRLNKNGLNYRVPPAGLQLIDGKLHANTAFPGLTIYYTTNGKTLDETSKKYTIPIIFEKDKNYQFRVKGGKDTWSRVSCLNNFQQNLKDSNDNCLSD